MTDFEFWVSLTMAFVIFILGVIVGSVMQIMP